MAAIEEKLNEQQGHWILARLGKRVLRPGGRELTNKMIERLQIGQEDDLVEFAPGVGFTASLACAKNPRSYTGVDRNKEALALADKRVHHPNKQMILADAFNLLTHPRYLKRVKQMRATFRRYYSNMQAIAIVARKI